MSINERDSGRAFVKRMEEKARQWDNRTLEKYIDDCTSYLTQEQIAHLSWYLGVKAEDKKRFMTEHQNDNQSESAYGDSEDERGPED